MQKYKRNRLIVLAALALLGGVAVLMWVGILPGFKGRGPSGPVSVTLEFWNVFDSEDLYADAMANFKAANPNVSINYKKVEFSEYRKKLTEAFANGNPPDIFAIHNTWLPLQKNRIQPAPSNIISVPEFKEIFPKVVEFDFYRATTDGAGLIYALPLSIETLGLFYNKDYFETYNISFPPKTWEELLDYAKLFTQYDEFGEISLAGISLGTIDNINRSTDIMALLMMQSGTRMNNAALTEATFDDTVAVGEGEKREVFFPAKDALEFYLAFSDNKKTVYSWNKEMIYSIDAFVEGKSAMMINYPHHILTIKEKAPHLNFGVSAMPQLKDRTEDINYANYWGFAVSKNSLNANTAWSFIRFLTKPDNLKNYLEAARMPTPRKDLILYQQKDPELKHFANQILSARSWYQGDPLAVESIFRDMAQSAAVGEVAISEALEDAAVRVTLVIKNIIEQ